MNPWLGALALAVGLVLIEWINTAVRKRNRRASEQLRVSDRNRSWTSSVPPHFQTPVTRHQGHTAIGAEEEG